jgi:hypothetical protein
MVAGSFVVVGRKWVSKCVEFAGLAAGRGCQKAVGLSLGLKLGQRT